MATKVSICNMALSLLGSKSTIQNIDDDTSTEARVCKTHYDQALETCLSYADWSFATKTATSALMSADPPGDWAYAYAYPADCIRLTEIIPAAGRQSDRKPFEIATISGQRVILTDEESPTWRYVYRNTNPALYSPPFVDAMVAQLAYRISMQLTRKIDLMKMARESYYAMIAAAAAHDANVNAEIKEDELVVAWHEDRL